MDKKNYLAIFAKSFNWAGFFLPKKIYEDCTKLYAFCRILDDIADGKTNLDTRIILDTTRSKIAWLGGLKFAVSNHDGELKMSNGNISLKNNIISGTVVMDMNSMTNNDLSAGSKERLIGHLKSPDFFHVTKFPKAKLNIKSSKILEKLESGKYKMLINGDMTIKDKTNSISFEAIVDLDSDIKTAQGKLSFDRSAFGVEYRSEMHLDNPNSFTLSRAIQYLSGDAETPRQYLMAGSVIVTLPVLFIFVYFEKYLVSGLTAGSVKG